MKRFAALLCALFLLRPTGCAPTAPAREDELVVLTSTYPVYLLTCSTAVSNESNEAPASVSERLRI